MEKTLKVGILRETKNPPDRRVPLSPPQKFAIEEYYPNEEFFDSTPTSFGNPKGSAVKPVFKTFPGKKNMLMV